MNKFFLSIIILIAVTGCSSPSNFAECVVQDLKGVQNEQVFAATYRSCIADFPQSYKKIEQGSGRGFFSYENREECVIDNAKNITSERASQAVSFACACLYDEPKWKGQTC